MKILFYGDTHIKETSVYLPFNRIQDNGLTGELNNILLGYKFVARCILDLAPDLVINLGDTYHLDDYISVRSIHTASIGLNLIKTTCDDLNIDHLMLIGNHDKISDIDGNVVSPIHSLCGYGEIINTEYSYSLDDYSIYFIPHTDDIDIAYQGLLNGSKHDLIVTHLDFMGAVYENTHENKVGLDPNTTVPVVSGHIHIPQQVGKVYYPGSLIQRTFSKSSLDSVGGVLTFDTSKKKSPVIRYPNNLSKHFIKINDIGQLSNLDPEKCILKVVIDTPLPEIAEVLKDFTYMYVPHTYQHESDIKTTYIRHEIEKPETLLRSFIAEDNPEALEIYDKVVK